MSRSLALIVAAVLLALLRMPALGQASDTAVLTGLVVDQNQNPLHHARISLETGQWTSSAEDGSFRLDGISPGSHDVTVNARDHHVGEKVVEFGPGQQKSMLVQLTSDRPAAAVPRANTGTFYVQAYPYETGDKKYYVKRVQVSQYDNQSKSWSQYRWNGNDGPGIYLPCEGGVVGAHYSIQITWRTSPNPDGTNDDQELTGSWYKTFDYEWETFTFYGPY